MTPRAASRAIPPRDPTIAGTRGTTAVLFWWGVAGVAVGVVPGPPAGVAPGVKNGASKDDVVDENAEIDDSVDIDDSADVAESCDAVESKKDKGDEEVPEA